MKVTHTTVEWADGEHKFHLRIGEMRELQDKTGVGPFALMTRLLKGDWRVDDVRETLRLALIGGGAKPIDALNLVKRYVDDKPLLDNVSPALQALNAALAGEDKDSPPKKSEAQTESPTI